MSLVKQLREVGTILGLNCGDNGCVFGERTGAGTNGGCQCDLVEAVMTLKAAGERSSAWAAVHESVSGTALDESCWYRDREPLVRGLVQQVAEYTGEGEAAGSRDDCDCDVCAMRRSATAVRDFKVVEL